MKELSIEEKAKRFDEALGKARRYYDEYKTRDNILYVEDMEDMFPELKESEDERIRKALVEAIRHNYVLTGSINHIPTKDILAWLEKQGKQKTVDEIAKEVCKNRASATIFLKSAGIINEKGELAEQYRQSEQNTTNKVEPKFKVGQTIKKEGFNLGFNIVKIKDGFYYNNVGDNFPFTDQDNWELVEQKPAWSKEDDIMAHDIDYALRCQITYPIFKLQSMSNWILNLKDRVQPQNSIVTNEELAQAKKDAYNNVLDKIEYDSENPTFDDGWSAAIWYLKKRNAQPQSTWKPSDEQMEGIECTIKTLRYQLNAGDNRLDSLYNDLKKLREK